MVRGLTEACRRAAASDWQAPPVSRPDSGGVRFFHASLPESLSRAHPALPYVVVMPILAFWAYRAVWSHSHSASVLIVAFGAGWLIWTLTEYLMHRFLFHFPARGEKSRVATFLVHGHHHVYPTDTHRLVATPLQHLSLLLLAYGLARVALPSGVEEMATTGFGVGYLAYEYVHLICHHGVPRTPWMRALRRHHLRHHHQDPGARWGISSPLWDWVFRTL